MSQPAAIGRLGQVCDRWIYSACLCFGLDLDEQERSGFRYAYSVYQVEYSRNLIFRDGRQLDRLFNTVADRARSRLDVPAVRTLSGARRRPGKYGTRGLSPRLGVVIETPAWDLTVFKVHFGLLTLKTYSKGEHVLRFEAIALEKFPEIVTRLAGMAGRFCTALDCVHTAFIADGMLDELPRPAQLGKMRVGGIDLNKPRIRAVLQAVLALAAAPAGFTVADLTAKVCAMTGQQDYTARQAGYDLRKLRGKGLVARLGRTRRYHVPPLAARTITALLALRDQVIAPILTGIRSPAQRTQARQLDRRRPRLRKSPHRHAVALPAPGHPRRPPRGIGGRTSIDKLFAIMEPQVGLGKIAADQLTGSIRCRSGGMPGGPRTRIGDTPGRQ